MTAPTEPDARVPAAVKVLAVVAVLGGVAFRFITKSGLWLDEALSANIAALPPGEILSWLRHDGHPPLYYLLLHGWTQVVGESDVAVRSLSAVFGLASLPLAYVAGRRRGGSLLGWLAVTVFAASPFAIRYSNEARMYSLVPLLVLAGYLLIDDVVRQGRRQPLRLASLALLSGALLLSHYWALWFLGAVGLVLLWQWRRAPEPGVRAGALHAAGALITGGVFFVWWLPAMLYQAAHTGTPWAQSPRPTVMVSLILTDFSSATQFPDSALITVCTAVLFLLGVFGVAVDRRRIDIDLLAAHQLRFEAVVIALTLGIGVVVGFATHTAFASRYASVLLPLFLLAVAAGFTRFADPRLLAGAVAAWLVLAGVAVAYNAFVYQRTQAPAVAEAIRAKGAPGDTVVFCPDQLGPAGSRALGPGFVTMAFPRLDDPRLVDWVDYGDRNAAVDVPAVAREVVARTPADRAIFVVWATGYRTLEGDCEALIAAISDVRPVVRSLVDARNDKYYEPASVFWFAPKSGTAS